MAGIQRSFWVGPEAGFFNNGGPTSLICNWKYFRRASSLRKRAGLLFSSCELDVDATNGGEAISLMKFFPLLSVSVNVLFTRLLVALRSALASFSRSRRRSNHEASLPTSCDVCQCLSCALLMRVRKRERGCSFD
jgi:hypothetical protein